MSDFETKKKLLVAESEVYRQLLKLEFQTFKVYAKRTKRQLTSARSYVPLIMTGLPLLGSLFGRKRGSSLNRMGTMAVLGWKAFQQISHLFGHKKAPEDGQTAAQEYLSKRL